MTNLCIAWVEFQKFYDTISCLVIIKAPKLIGGSSKIFNLIKSTMNVWKIKLVSSDNILGENSIIMRNVSVTFCTFWFL